MTELRTATEKLTADLADDNIMPIAEAAPTGLFRTTLASLKAYFLAGGSTLPAGGSTGQVLTKLSATDGDADWEDATGGGGGGGIGGGPAFEAHLYWRILFPSAAGGFFAYSAAEVEMRATVGGANQCSGGTAFSDNAFTAAANAFDGDAATFWSTAAFSGSAQLSNIIADIGYQFAAPVKVLEVKLTAKNQSSDDAKQLPLFGFVQYSDDGQIYTTAFSYGLETYATTGTGYEFSQAFTAAGGGGIANPYDAPPTKPLVADWTQKNFSGATVVADGMSSLILTDTTITNQGIRALVQAAPAAPWDFYVRCETGALKNNAQAIGLIIANSAENKIISLGRNGGPSFLSMNRWTAWEGGFITSTFDGSGDAIAPKWFRVENDGTNINWYVSINGYDWEMIATELLSAFIGSADLVGFFGIAGQAKMFAQFQSASFEAPA